MFTLKLKVICDHDEDNPAKDLPGKNVAGQPRGVFHLARQKNDPVLGGVERPVREKPRPVEPQKIFADFVVTERHELRFG